MSQLNPYSYFPTPPQMPGTALRPHSYTGAGTDPADIDLANQQRMMAGSPTFGQMDQQMMGLPAPQGGGGPMHPLMGGSSMMSDSVNGMPALGHPLFPPFGQTEQRSVNRTTPQRQ